jgi:hypothetical protein
VCLGCSWQRRSVQQEPRRRVSGARAVHAVYVALSQLHAMPALWSDRRTWQQQKLVRTPDAASRMMLAGYGRLGCLLPDTHVCPCPQRVMEYRHPRAVWGLPRRVRLTACAIGAPAGVVCSTSP